MPAQTFFATCPRGLEPVLACELEACGAAGTEPGEGGVAFTGDMPVAWQANLHSRVAGRVLWRVAVGRCASEDDVYRLAATVDWPDLFTVDNRLRVDVSGRRSPLRSFHFAGLRVKDAVCDTFRRQVGRRPSVDLREPDVRLQLFVDGQRGSLYVDTSGEPLFKRGWRQGRVKAPLRANLAAGILALSGWQPGEEALLDPFCGGGTFLVEAAMQALDRAPGLGRGFGFERLRNFDGGAWDAIIAEAEAVSTSPRRLDIHGSDDDGRALKTARQNLAAAGLDEAVSLSRGDVLTREAPAAHGVIVANPPYGERIGEDEALAAFYPRLGDALKQHFPGWRAYILTADMRLPKLIGLKPSKRTPLFNGGLECRLYEIVMVSGRPARGDA